MAVKITLNRPHMFKWLRWLYAWFVYVIIALIAGWHLKPRPDEIQFVVLLPLVVIVPWAILSLLAAVCQSLWPKRFEGRLRSRRIASLEADKQTRE